MLKRNVRWSVPLGQVGGIPIRLHVVFLLIIAFLGLDSSAEASNIMSFLVALLLCVILHELAHLGVAKILRLEILEIELYPFGGVSRMASTPSPKLSFVLAAAGPFANVLFALILSPFVEIPENPAALIHANVPTRLCVANVGLLMCNLLPALPLDGGTLLQSALEIFKVDSAHKICVKVSQAISIAIGILGLITGNILFVALAVVIFRYALVESMRIHAHSLADSLLVKDVMTPVSQLLCFPHSTTIPKAVDSGLQSFQSIFPVLHSEELMGLVERDALFEAAATGTEQDYVSSIMTKDYGSIAPNSTLKSAELLLRSSPGELLVVEHESVFYGILFQEKVVEFLLVKSLRERSSQIAAIDNELF